jgi:putative toxin-antitoxin system antitoxin component (TIGR02293 family)
MSAKPSEVYERLKDLRRQGDGPQIQSKIGHQLKAIYDDAVRQSPLDHFAELLRKLHDPDVLTGKADHSANLIRILEIKSLADRIFGDEKNADAWLLRPHASLSGQKPCDLLNDELGTALVREMLEQIDHGIFA